MPTLYLIAGPNGVIYGDKDGHTVKVLLEDRLRENPNLIRERMGNGDPPIGHRGPLTQNQTFRGRVTNE